jgi:MinD-like ATPase involved in chromosome partitioning or flagellar assembly|tara:strand:- start:1158 stop:1766 length:609 start_codon:yes stop_codon:yes gene_type:complete
MKGIAVSSSRGGCGKTSLAHALALGCGWNNTLAYLCHTDNRDPIKTIDRPYGYYDCRDTTRLAKLASLAAEKDDGFFIIDSGGNRPKFDAWIATSMDLILIPVSPDSEDVSEALAHHHRLVDAGAMNIKFVINKYPNAKSRQPLADKILALIPEGERLVYLPEVSAIRNLRMTDEEAFKTPPTNVNNLARKLFRAVRDYDKK